MTPTFAWVGEVALMAEACDRLAPFFPHVRTGLSREDALALATELLCARHPLREVVRATGLGHWTAQDPRRRLILAGRIPATCLCGRPATHRGRCHEREQRKYRAAGAAA